MKKMENDDRMDKEKFVKAAVNSGYCDKKTAEEYAASTGKREFDSDDFVGAYRFKSQFYGGRSHKNSYGSSVC